MTVAAPTGAGAFAARPATAKPTAARSLAALVPRPVVEVPLNTATVTFPGATVTTGAPDADVDGVAGGTIGLSCLLSVNSSWDLTGSQISTSPSPATRLSPWSGTVVNPTLPGFVPLSRSA